MGKDKLKRFKENLTFNNLIQPGNTYPLKDHPLKGCWKKDFFKNDNPIVLELGCGRGEYTINLAEKYPQKNFLGIDFKGARLWRGAKTAIEENRTNAGFLRIQIQNICYYFAPDEVEEIWITFPDPQLTKPGERKRLTSPRFIDLYRNIMVESGIINLKTDSKTLYEYTLETIELGKLDLLVETSDLYASSMVDDVLSIKTTYEKIWLSEGVKICYIRFSLK
jgi:tRNA (guanine-N7-)-methyltransferase